MSWQIRILVLAVAALCLIGMLNMIRRNKLELRYALPWFLIWLGVVLVDLFPGIMQSGARLLGIALPINMLYFLAIVFLLIMSFVLTTIASQTSRRTKELAQELALLREEWERTQVEKGKEEVHGSTGK